MRWDLRDWAIRVFGADALGPPDEQRQAIHEAIAEQSAADTLRHMAASIDNLASIVTDSILSACPGLDRERVAKALRKELWIVIQEHEEFAAQGAYLS